MLIEYAIDKDTKKIMHIDSVPNGAKCNCICKACNDELTARNGGTQRQHHFAHRNFVESRPCLMTQLHLAMQHYFLGLAEIVIPSEEFEYHGVVLKTPPVKVNVLSSRLEQRIGKFISDVYINTNIGDFYIEICVTHRCEQEKIDFYKNSKINSIELTFEYSDDVDIIEWLERIKENKIPYEWFYYNEKEKVISHYEQELIKENNERRTKRTKSAQVAIRKLLKEKIIFLPSIKHEFTYTESNEHFSEIVSLYNKKNRSLDKIELIQQNLESFVLKGEIIRNDDKYVIWIIYSLSDNKLNLSDYPQGSIIIRSYPNHQNKPEWQWLRHPSLEKERSRLYSIFINSCKEKIHTKSQTIFISNQLKHLSYNYLDANKEFFNQDYRKWYQWLIQNNIFRPTDTQKWPKIPAILKERIEYPFLWMFQRWSVLVMSTIIEIVDQVPTGKGISMYYLFDKLLKKFPPHERFIELENIAEYKTVQAPHRCLIF
ncbi:TPA: hypothetical protein O7147_003544, partial [Salmonella enterica]|nr:hypothetical protein [Salmonella enterica]